MKRCERCAAFIAGLEQGCALCAFPQECVPGVVGAGLPPCVVFVSMDVHIFSFWIISVLHDALPTPYYSRSLQTRYVRGCVFDMLRSAV